MRRGGWLSRLSGIAKGRSCSHAVSAESFERQAQGSAASAAAPFFVTETILLRGRVVFVCAMIFREEFFGRAPPRFHHCVHQPSHERAVRSRLSGHVEGKNLGLRGHDQPLLDSFWLLTLWHQTETLRQDRQRICDRRHTLVE